MGLLGWIGWAIGLLVATIEISRWLKERQREPIMSALFERELRDRQGAYTEAQIKELTDLFEDLTRQIRVQIPELARRSLLESRRQQIAESLKRDYEEYASLTTRMAPLPSADSLPAQLRDAIRDEIAPSSERRNRQRRTLYAVIGIVGLLAIFPYPRQFLSNALSEEYGYNAAVLQLDVLPYLGGMTISLILALYSPWSRYQLKLVRHPFTALMVAIFCLGLWVLALTLIVLGSIEDPRNQNLIAIASLIPLGVGVRIGYLLLRWRRSIPRGAS